MPRIGVRAGQGHRRESWIAAGVDTKTVSTWLGHSSAKLTLDTYGHVMGTDADREAADRVNRAFAEQLANLPLIWE